MRLAKIQMDDTDKYLMQLYKLEDYAEGIIKRSIYEGAGVVADQINQEIDSIPNIYSYQKKDLKNGMGIAEIKKDGKGGIDTKIGFSGYGSVPTKKYPKGLPNLLLARAIVSGTSFRSKTPFIRRAVTKSRQKALEAMEKQVDKDIQEIMEKN